MSDCQWTLAATMKDLRRRRKMLVDVNGTPVALFLVDGRVYALHDVCIHKQRSLSKGTVLRGRVICPGHQWAFDLETGYAEDQDRCQVTYGVKVDEEEIYVCPEGRILFPPCEPQADAPQPTSALTSLGMQ